MQLNDIPAATGASGGRGREGVNWSVRLAAVNFSQRSGVTRIFGVNFSGFVAWWLWRPIYLSKLPRIEKKVRVALDWTLDLLFAKDFVQFLTVRSPVMSSHESGLTDRTPADSALLARSA